MNRRDIELNLKKINATFTLNNGASLEQISEAETWLGLHFPADIIHFF